MGLEWAIQNDTLRHLQNEKSSDALVLTWRSYEAVSTGQFNSNTAMICSRKTSEKNCRMVAGDSHKRLLFDACKFLTKTRGRETYGDKVELSGQVDTNVALPNWAFGQVIDATPQAEQLTDQSSDNGVPIDADYEEEKTPVDRKGD